MIMTSNIRSLLVFGAGFVSGWAARSVADSPQGVGVKILEVAINAKERVSRWAAVEGERLEDMLAEARSKTEPPPSGSHRTTNGSGHKARAVSREA
jgi:hypothetical protein